VRVEVSQGPVPEVTIIGPRQCGKTERMIDMVIGAIIAGGTPTVATRTSSEARDVRDRLARRLYECGINAPKQTADRVVYLRSGLKTRYHGRTGPIFFEEDE